jgi:hypothetical protein
VSHFAKMMNPYDKKMNPLDKTGPSASPSSAASTAGRMGDSTSLSKQKKKATNYINQYLREDEHLPNSIDELTDEHMEGEHLKNLWRILAIGLPARNLIPSRKHPLVIKLRKSTSRRQKRY